MFTPMPKNKSDFLGFRSSVVSERLRELLILNPELKMSEIIRAAVIEKLDRLERGQDEGIKLRVSSPSQSVSPRPKK